MRYIITEQQYKLITEVEDPNENRSYDDLFVELGWLKYYGDGTEKELRNIPKLERILSKTPKPEIIPIPEDTRKEWGGVKLGDVVSAEELPEIYEKMGYYADDSTGKFIGKYKLMYVPVIPTLTKYKLSDDYEDLEHLDRVNEYIETIRNGDELPPVIYTNGYFKDGAHRNAANVELGRKKILAFYGSKIKKPSSEKD